MGHAAGPVAEPRLVDAYRGVVCDLDGVVRRGPAAVPHAVRCLTALSVPVVYATNNASLTPGDVARQLQGLGLDATAADVVTSSQAGAAHLAEHVPPGSAVLAVGGSGVAAALTEVGLVPVTGTHEGVVAVLQGYGPQVSATDLAHAAYAIEAGARWVVTNRDSTLPTEHGVAPGNGALVAAVALATGTQPTSVGKPEPPLYHLAVGRLGCPAGAVLAVGDRLDTDIAGAMAAGLDSLWVLTGVDGLVSFAEAAGRPAPTFTATDLQALGLPAQRATPAANGSWVCGPVRLTVDWSGPAITVDGFDGLAGLDDGPANRNALLTTAVAALVQARDEHGAAADVLAQAADQVMSHLR